MRRIESPTFEIERKDILESILGKYGYDFRSYSPFTLRRMLVEAMDRLECLTLPALQEKILGSAESFDELIQSLTVPVSELFRDPEYYLAVREKVVPYLRTYPSVNVWVAGCSTGEEAYSLAIVFREEGLSERIRIYATDINARSLEKAARGVYSLSAFRNAEEKYAKSGGKAKLDDYYTPATNTATVDERLKTRITFSDHSLVTDSVFVEAQFISCRNVLIYFDRQLQDRAISLFHESLCKKGFLGFGKQETAQFSARSKDLIIFDKKARIYQRH